MEITYSQDGAVELDGNIVEVERVDLLEMENLHLRMKDQAALIDKLQQALVTAQSSVMSLKETAIEYRGKLSGKYGVDMTTHAVRDDGCIVKE